MSLNLFRCVICKRAFFDESRRNEHTMSEHRKSSFPTSNSTVSAAEKSCLNTTTRPVQNCEFSKHKPFKPTSVNIKHSKHRERRNMSRARHYAGRRLSGQFQYLLKHLDQLWPPDENSKIEGLKRFRKLGWLLSKITGHNYSKEKHGSVKIVQVLNHEFCQNKHLNEERIREIQVKTGVSQLYIKAWFKWKKNLELTTSPKKVLQESFYSCQYPSQETIKTIASVITSTPQKVESWFLISRVIADILDPSANDTKEMV
uniref:C2H2-type domain-containing protein n=3 Tax=Ciona intestinalis TaxID=7719 RepID=H2XWF4_CIOIN